MRRVAVFVCILIVCGTAHAGEKDPGTAKILSGTAAGVSGAVTLAGFLTRPSGHPFNIPVLYTGVGMLAVAPSLGEFYAGQYLTWGMGIRALATGFAIYTLETQTRAVRCDEVGASYELDCEIFTRTAYPMMGIAAIAFIGGVWYDVLDASDAAERHNRGHGITAVPTAMHAPHGLVPGIALGGTF